MRELKEKKSYGEIKRGTKHNHIYETLTYRLVSCQRSASGFNPFSANVSLK